MQNGQTYEVPGHVLGEAMRFLYDKEDPIDDSKIIFALSIAFACGAMHERTLARRPLIPAGPGVH